MRQFISDLRQIVFFFRGLVKYWFTRENSPQAHLAMVHFFCRSGGTFNEWCLAWMRLFSRPLPLPHKSGVLGDMSGEAGKASLQQLKEKGYAVFERALSQEACDRLLSFAMSTPAIIRPMDGETREGPPRIALFSPDQPLAIRYDYKTTDLLVNQDVQALLADASLLTLAQDYLGVRPRADVLSMWWHTHFHDRADSQAAQMFHFDLDRLKWLKIFIYLTDVNPNDGPHSFIEGTHASHGIPQKFLERGYVRLGDEEVLAEFGHAREKVFSAPRGTIIVEDTRGLHKGSVASGNPRLMLQLQLSASLFGTIYPKASLPRERIPELEAMIKLMPDVYQAYL